MGCLKDLSNQAKGSVSYWIDTITRKTHNVYYEKFDKNDVNKIVEEVFGTIKKRENNKEHYKEIIESLDQSLNDEVTNIVSTLLSNRAKKDRVDYLEKIKTPIIQKLGLRPSKIPLSRDGVEEQIKRFEEK